MAADNNALSPDEIDALLNAAQSGAPPQPAQQAPASPSDTQTQDAAETSPEASAEDLLDRAEADLAAAVAPNLDAETALQDAAPFELQSFDEAVADDADGAILGTLQDVELDVRIELGRAELLIEEVLKLKQGSVVPLDKLAGDPVDILVNGRLIARGEVLVLNDNFCVRIAEILAPDF